jgi:hypothetical protein
MIRSPPDVTGGFHSIEQHRHGKGSTEVGTVMLYLYDKAEKGLTPFIRAAEVMLARAVPPGEGRTEKDRSTELGHSPGEIVTRAELLEMPEGRAALEAWEHRDGSAFEAFERGYIDALDALSDAEERVNAFH